MTYVTKEDIQSFMGFSNRDMKVNGVQMSDAQFTDFCNEWIPKIAQMVHRFCNVISFEPTQIIEYRNGRGASDDDSSTSDYLDSDVEFYLRNLYLTSGATPVYAPIVIEEDSSAPTASPSWSARTERSASLGGDYRVLTDRDVTHIRFHNNIPRQGVGNVRFTYFTGYLPTSQEFGDIRLQILRAFKNLIMLKKKTQEASTIRNYAVRDYSQMFEPFDESSILSESEKTALERYRRIIFDGPMYY
jgi:hypothetical protein